jgi:hypothetical protein
MDTLDIALRLCAASLVGIVLGLNRDLHGKPTGQRRARGSYQITQKCRLGKAANFGIVSKPARSSRTGRNESELNCSA